MGRRTLKAKYDGKCQVCGLNYAAGTEIVAVPPKGRHRRWITRHRACHTLGGEKVTVRYECPICGGPHPKTECLGAAS